jgi:hypothetical protein
MILNPIEEASSGEKKDVVVIWRYELRFLRL